MRSGHPESYGKEFYPPGLPSVSAASGIWSRLCSAACIMRSGINIGRYGAGNCTAGRETLSGVGAPCPYRFWPTKDPIEYFCETFAAYRFEDGLADKDPQRLRYG